ncbi:MAG: hypothetical protein KA354_17370 [Phycisphaerae bacterium]|nr:hypothetical protein [Phycisphaerae bacterium]
MNGAARTAVFCGLMAPLACAATAWAAPLLTPGDFVIAIDLDPDGTTSRYPAKEAPAMACDALLNTKYLNYSMENSGLIITPASGPSVVQSIRFSTANDHEERDPASYELYGTNAAIASTDNSDGEQESWTLIASGTLVLPSARQAVDRAMDFANTASYTSYKVIFPTLKRVTTPNSMQIAEIELFTGAGGTGTPVLGTGGTVLAIDRDLVPQSSYPAGEAPAFAIDNRPNKYLNYGKANTGLIVAPWVGPTVVTSLQIMTANDDANRDPSTYALYGTNEAVLSTDNSRGNKENWTLIASGDLALPADRNVLAPAVTFENAMPYLAYRLVFPTLRDAVTADSMQIGEVRFCGTMIEAPPIPLLAPGDPILAVDSDPDTSMSNYPEVETPAMACDGDLATKYLNFAKENSGLIAASTPGASIVRSLRLITGNDAPERDPVIVEVYGTNAPIASADNSWGTAEPWTLIASSGLEPPIDRTTVYPVFNFANETSYNFYKILFSSIKDTATANAMQVTEIGLYTEADAAGTNVLLGSPAVLAVDADVLPVSSYPAAETPSCAIDRSLAKYLNFGMENSGFIVTPAAGRTIVNVIRMTSANDWNVRDPILWTLYGTLDAVASTDNSQGDAEQWTLIASGASGLPTDRNRLGAPVSFGNTAAYDSYKLVFSRLRDPGTANAVQVAEIQFYGAILGCPAPFADADGDGDVDQVDFGEYQACFTGRGGANSTYECRCFDRDNDGDIDLVDFAEFQKCATGPAVTWTQDLLPDCAP